MKQKDLAVLIAVLVASVIISVVISSLIFGSPKSQQVATVDKITPDFPVSQVQGNDKQFNDQAFNPAQIVNIGQPNNHPFTGGNQQ